MGTRKLGRLRDQLFAMSGVVMCIVSFAFVIYYGSVTQGSRALAEILTHRSYTAFLFAAGLLLTLIISKIFDAVWENARAIAQWTVRRVVALIVTVGVLFELLYVFGLFAEALFHIALSP